ncbi:MAG TPA: phage tail length tape measure family protein, partial [Chroococcales cyanobacterium]
MQIGQLELDFMTNLAQFTSDIGEVKGLFGSLKTSVEESMDAIKVATEVLALEVVLEKASEGFRVMMEAAEQTEQAMTQVKASIAATGNAAGVTADQISQMADAMQEKLGVDHAAVEAADAILLTYNKIGGETLPAATQAVLDLSAKMGGDLNSAAKLVGRALQDPEQGLSRLARAGVTLTASQKDLIKNLEDSGHAAEAQAEILKDLEDHLGGSAAAARDTLGGALKALGVDMQETAETVGNVTGAAKDFRFMIELADVSLEHLNKGIAKSGPELKAAFGTVFQDLGNAIKSAIPEISILSGEFEFLHGILAKIFPQFDKGLSDGVSNAVSGAKKEIDDIVKETEDRIKALNEAASKVRPQSPIDDADDAQAKKKASELQKERDLVKGLIDDQWKKVASVEAELKGQKDLNDELTLDAKISAQGSIPWRERIGLINQLHQAMQQLNQDEETKRNNQEATDLQKVLQNLQDQVKVEKDKIAGVTSESNALKAQEQIQQALKGHLNDQLGLQKQINDAAKQLDALKAQEQAAENAKKEADAIASATQEIQKQNDALQAKISGLDAVNDELQKENELREKLKNLGDTPEDIEKQVAALKQLYQTNKDLNDTYNAQLEVVKKIMDSTGTQAQKQQQLDAALQTGTINVKEYNDALAKLQTNQKAAAQDGDQFAKILTGGLQNAISGTQSLTDAFKQLGQQLLQFAEQQFLLKPLESMLTNIYNSIMGVGNQSIQVPSGIPGVGNLQTSNPGTIGQGTNPLSSLLHQLHIPGFATGGDIAQNQLAMVGEEGPELFLPSTSGTILPNWLLTELMYGMQYGPASRNAPIYNGTNQDPQWTSLLGWQDAALDKLKANQAAYSQGYGSAFDVQAAQSYYNFFAGQNPNSVHNWQFSSDNPYAAMAGGPGWGWSAGGGGGGEGGDDGGGQWIGEGLSASDLDFSGFQVSQMSSPESGDPLSGYRAQTGLQ